MTANDLKNVIEAEFYQHHIDAQVSLSPIDETSDWHLLDITWNLEEGVRAGYALTYGHPEGLSDDWREMIVSRTKNNIEVSYRWDFRNAPDTITFYEVDGTISDHFPSDPPIVRVEGAGEWVTAAQARRTYEILPNFIESWLAEFPEDVKKEGDVILLRRAWLAQQDASVTYASVRRQQEALQARVMGYYAGLRMNLSDLPRVNLGQYYQKQGGDPDFLDDFELGFLDARDESLSVTEAAQKAGVGRRYIKDEIERGKLRATKVGRQYQIRPSDFAVWMANPRRGSRRRNEE